MNRKLAASLHGEISAGSFAPCPWDSTQCLAFSHADLTATLWMTLNLGTLALCVEEPD